MPTPATTTATPATPPATATPPAGTASAIEALGQYLAPYKGKIIGFVLIVIFGLAAMLIGFPILAMGISFTASSLKEGRATLQQPLKELGDALPSMSAKPTIVYEAWHETLLVRGSFPPHEVDEWQRDPSTGEVKLAFTLATSTQVTHYTASAKPVAPSNRKLSGTWRTVEETAPGKPLAYGLWKPEWSANEMVLQGECPYDPAITSVTAGTRASPPHITLSF